MYSTSKFSMFSPNNLSCFLRVFDFPIPNVIIIAIWNNIDNYNVERYFDFVGRYYSNPRIIWQIKSMRYE